MDIVWNKSNREKFSVNSQLGQSTVEYILLFAVVVAVSLSILKSTKFNQLFGRDGTMMSAYRKQVESAYRHGLAGNEGYQPVNYRSGNHKSYNGRFFSAKDGYPR